MSHVIDLGCRVAEVHRRYHEIHGAMFGAASFRLLIDALRGRRRRVYDQFARTLETLQDELSTLQVQIAEFAQGDPVKGAGRELQQVLPEYTGALRKAIAGLQDILVNLEQDETAYRDAAADGRSRFTRDKLEYDRRLLELERLGSRLNRLFSNY